MSETQQATIPVFTAYNVHVPQAGDGPGIVKQRGGAYHSYFENEQGEQWVFAYDREARKGVLRGGDVGWNREYEVEDGQVFNLVLGALEREWLGVCWRAATAFNT